MSKFTWEPARTIKECEEIITAPGQFHEVEHAIINGAVYRVYKNLWPSIREYWLNVVSNKPEIHTRDYIVYEDYRITYGQADELVQRTASMFREVYGVRKGDRVGIAMRNYPEWIISFFAAGILGAIPTLFNAWLPIEPFLHCIKLTTPKLIIVDSERQKLLSPHFSALNLSVIVVRPSPGFVRDADIREWSDVLSSYSGSIKAWEKEPNPLADDDATIFFTSGTTGNPKGVLSSQRGFLGNFFNGTVALRRRELRRGRDLPPPIGAGPVLEEAQAPMATLLALPLFHVIGCTGQLINATTLGGKVVLIYKWDKEEAARLILKENISTTMGVPSMAYDLLESSIVGNKGLTVMGFGGGSAADTLPGELARKFPNAMIQQGYGLSETNTLAICAMGEDLLERPASTGLPLSTVDLLIVDPKTNKPLPTGQTGEIWIRGPNVMRGYYNNPKATAEAITRDGWFKSGDLGSIDGEGFVYIKDRVKDVIIRGGENIHSTTVENALFADERVLDCAAVGIPDRRLGELVGAVVVPRQQWAGRLNEHELVAKVKSRLPAFALPSMILIQNEPLERNAVGKTVKAGLRTKVREEWTRRNGEKARGKL